MFETASPSARRPQSKDRAESMAGRDSDSVSCGSDAASLRAKNSNVGRRDGKNRSGAVHRKVRRQQSPDESARLEIPVRTVGRPLVNGILGEFDGHPTNGAR